MFHLNNEKVLVNFRLPTEIKQRFEDVCKFNGGNMTYVLTGLIREYLRSEASRDPGYVRGNSSMGNPVRGTVNPASRTTIDNWFTDDPTPVKSAPDRVGNWVKNPISNTWEPE